MARSERPSAEKAFGEITGARPLTRVLRLTTPDVRHLRHAFDKEAANAGRLKPYARGIRLNMLALIAYRSYHGATTVWAFVVAILIVLVAGWYIRRRK
ncbi:hypothetical protein [Streptomyces sp. NPDC006333]|uniref:hypothetical protein n=1 Tax=Streptomyces sp. NPDC006333 TaxID=3156753 RepID=UPI0033A0A90D